MMPRCAAQAPRAAHSNTRNQWVCRRRWYKPTAACVIHIHTFLHGPLYVVAVHVPLFCVSVYPGRSRALSLRIIHSAPPYGPHLTPRDARDTESSTYSIIEVRGASVRCMAEPETRAARAQNAKSAPPLLHAWRASRCWHAPALSFTPLCSNSLHTALPPVLQHRTQHPARRRRTAAATTTVECSPPPTTRRVAGGGAQ